MLTENNIWRHTWTVTDPVATGSPLSKALLVHRVCVNTSQFINIAD